MWILCTVWFFITTLKPRKLVSWNFYWTNILITYRPNSEELNVVKRLKFQSFAIHLRRKWKVQTLYYLLLLIQWRFSRMKGCQKRRVPTETYGWDFPLFCFSWINFDWNFVFGDGFLSEMSLSINDQSVRNIRYTSLNILWIAVSSIY